MKKMLVLCSCLFLISATVSTKPKHKIWILGDSTLCHYETDPKYKITRVGWADVLQSFLISDSAEVHNKAISGRSTKDFINYDNGWNTFKDSISAGDVVIIEFGHNDEKYKTSPSVGVRPDSFKINLKMYVDFVKSKGAIPILGTPIARNKWTSGKINYDHVTKDTISKATESQYSFVTTSTLAGGDSLWGYYDYPPVVLEVASEKSVAVVDMRKLTTEFFESIGQDSTSKFFAVDTAGKVDNTHINRTGALALSKLFVDNATSQNLLPISKWFKGTTSINDKWNNIKKSATNADPAVIKMNATSITVSSAHPVVSYNLFSLKGDVIVSGNALNSNTIPLNGNVVSSGKYLLDYTTADGARSTVVIRK